MKVTGFPKATYYYWVNCFERVNKDELIEKEMLKIRQEHANAGYRPMSELLKQRGYQRQPQEGTALNEEARASCDVLLAQIT
ncbi:hypothetical protein LLUL021_14295 (plasmid) [Lactococcus lactis subsp. lactis]|nr:hypothetical protein [Lactococcus lactis]WGU42661.1 hypothetical protein LLUL021_14295 [Lactococcus lactis subsp. lactis]